MMPKNQKNLKSSIKNITKKHHFDLCYFTKPIISQHLQKKYDTWVEQGMHAEMDYMSESQRMHLRKNPQEMLSDVKTVICLGMFHSPPLQSLSDGLAKHTHGVIASYAQGDDYHEVMKKRLKAVAAELDGLLGQHAQRVYVDTAPVLERPLAQQAGMGWQGKHGLTIHWKKGSYLMLAEIFTSADLEIDEAVDEHCGSCQRCLNVCPTSAIVAPYVVDARLCISYLSIEHKGMIPHALRSSFGNRIFGCDDCQQVCPWNRLAHTPNEDILKPRLENDMPELSMLMHLDEVKFREFFRKSPVKRLKRKGLLRNVAIAMGNSKDHLFINVLMDALRDEEPLIRAHAAWALYQIQPIEAALLLAQHLKNEKNADVVLDIEYTLGESNHD
ncbi:MAG: tRNA epoxyqueuosine(34) reductase QueG [Mariprofundaceae bacterium]|nr:tRNA epoxyqueuosine(34) reductase QueG [Mariprofundaceae bacterium]